MKTLILSILILLPSLGQAALEEWHPINQKLFKSYLVLNAVDTMQTFDMIDCQNSLGTQCRYLERNSLIGTHPNKTEVLLLKAVSLGTAYYFLDKHYSINTIWGNSNKPKFIALVIMNLVYIDTVSNNHSIGLRLSWEF